MGEYITPTGVRVRMENADRARSLGYKPVGGVKAVGGDVAPRKPEPKPPRRPRKSVK